MNLHLKRPLVFYDLETTSTDTQQAKIVSYCFIKMQEGQPRQILQGLINPGIRIPFEASEVHGITNDMVKDAPKFYQKAPEILTFIAGCDMGGHNITKYDNLVLYEEFAREGIEWDVDEVNFVDTFNIMAKMEPRTLGAALKFYCGKEIENAHDSSSDTYSSIEVLFGQYQKYDDLPDSVEELSKKFRLGSSVDLAGKLGKNEKGEYIYNFGKYAGKPVTVDPTYLDWMIGADFNRNTKKWARKIKNELSGKNNIRL
jgi:DNA polymerase-3 subunit epsilon